MELNITAFVSAHCDEMELFAESIANSGLDNIGAITWRNAQEAMSEPESWLTTELDTLVDWFAEFGAWDRDELEAMGGRDLNALLVQFIAGDYQLLGDDEGERMYQSDSGEWFFYVGV